MLLRKSQKKRLWGIVKGAKQHLTRKIKTLLGLLYSNTYRGSLYPRREIEITERDVENYIDIEESVKNLINEIREIEDLLDDCGVCDKEVYVLVQMILSYALSAKLRLNEILNDMGEETKWIKLD